LHEHLKLVFVSLCAVLCQEEGGEILLKNCFCGPVLVFI